MLTRTPNSLLFSSIVVATLTVGLFAGVGSTIPDAHAGSCGSATDCPDIGQVPDPDVRSVLHVTHIEDAFLNPRDIEPNVSTTWQITAKYISANSGTDCRCADESFVATADVDWDAFTANFVEVLNPGHGTNTAPFVKAEVCLSDTCYDSTNFVTNGYGYKLLVELAHTVWIDCPIDGLVPHYLDQVLYKTTNIDNGWALDGDCIQDPTATAMVPVTQTVQQGDNGAWVCSDTACPTGVNVQIKYQ